jgi:hypothetical protein
MLFTDKEKGTTTTQDQHEHSRHDDDQHLLALGWRFGGICRFRFC